MNKSAVSWLVIYALFLQVLPASTAVWVKASGPQVRYVFTCTNATPMVCTLDSVSGLAAGDTISVFGVCANDGLNHISTANGIRKIGAIVGLTISLQDNDGTIGVPNGTPIAGNGTWCSGAWLTIPGAGQYVVKLSQVNLVDGVRGWLDGDNGDTTRAWATGTANGLISLTVTSNVATATFGYDHGLSTGAKYAWWNTTSSTFTPAVTGREFTITVTGARTFTFPITIADGDYTHNDHCGAGVTPNGTIQGTDNCVRGSSRAVTSNWRWNAVLPFLPNPSSGAYRWAFDGGGGTLYDLTPLAQVYAYAFQFLHDQTNQGLVDAGLYIINNVERMGGSNFLAYELLNDGGNYELAAQASEQIAQLGIIYTAFKAYLTPTQKQLFLDKVMNDVSDATPCDKTLANAQVVASDVGAARTVTGTTFQLATTASVTDNVYNGQTIWSTGAITGQPSYAVITGYVGSTRTATVACYTRGANFGPCSGATPTSGDLYNIYPSAQLSTTATGTATMTGFGTTWNTVGAPDRKFVNDYVILNTNWESAINTGEVGSIVTAVTDDTHVTVTNQPGITGTTAPQLIFANHAWTQSSPKSCGLQWLQNHFNGQAGSQPISYPAWGGSGGLVALHSNISMNLESFAMVFYAATAEDDPRAQRWLASYTSGAVTELASVQAYYSGPTDSGINYGFGRASQGAYSIAWDLAKNFQNFPNLDLSGNWITSGTYYKLYGLHPEGKFGPPAYEGLWTYYGPAFGLAHWATGAPQAFNFALSGNVEFNPLSITSTYDTYLSETLLGLNTGGSVSNTSIMEMAVKVDPRAVGVDYRSLLPHQYYFRNTSYTSAVQLSGYPYTSSWYGGMVISRTGFSSAADTHVTFRSGSNIVSDHDFPQPGKLDIYKAGYLLCNDALPCSDVGSYDGILDFGNTGSAGLHAIPAVATMPRWSGTNPTGDPSSTYTCWRGDVAGSYTTNPSMALIDVCHFKNSGDDEIIIVHNNVAASSQVIAKRLFYPQNLQTTAFSTSVLYDEGDTFCPGSGGCASLNMNRVVLEQQNGAGAGGNDPIRQYNMIDNFLFPSGAGSVCWDGISYSGATTWAYRASVYGSNTCNAASTTLRDFEIHKIATQPDTALTSTLLSGGAGWDVAQASNSVMATSSDGTDHTSAAFTSTCSGTCQVAVMGLASGVYVATVGGVPVSGSPFLVLSGDNSLHFFGTGATQIQQISGSGTILLPASAGGSAKVIH